MSDRERNDKLEGGPLYPDQDFGALSTMFGILAILIGGFLLVWFLGGK